MQRTDLLTELMWLSMDRFFSSVIPRTEIEISVASTETDGQVSDSATFMPLVAQTRQYRVTGGFPWLTVVYLNT